MSERKKDNFTIDDILDEAKFYREAGNAVYKGTDTAELLPESSWSMDDIDSLLKDVEAYRNPEPQEDVVFVPEQPKAEKVEEISIQEELYPEEDNDIKVIETEAEEEKEEVAAEDTSKTRILDTPHLNIENMADTGILSYGKNSPITKSADETEEKREGMVYEKPGLVIRSNEDGENLADDGLEPLPTLIPAHEFISATREYHKLLPEEKLANEEDSIAGQIKIVGFETDTDEEPIRIAESTVETELKRKKAEKLSKFTLYSDEDLDDAEKIPEEEEMIHEPVVYKEAEHLMPKKEEEEKPQFETVEDKKTLTEKLREFFRIEKEEVYLPEPDTNDAYVTDEGKIHILKDLTDRVKKNKKDMIILAALTVLLLLVTAIPASSSGGFGGGFGIFCLIMNIILLGAAFFIRKDCITLGINAIKRKTFNSQILLTLAGILTIIETFVAFFSDATANLGIYSAVVVFGLLLDSIGVHFKLSTIIRNFNFMNVDLKGRTYTIRTLEDKKFADSLGRGLLLGNPDIRYSARTKFASKFLELSFDKNLSDKYSEKIIPVAIIVSAVIGLISGLVSLSFLRFFEAFCCSLCVSLPIGSYLALNASLYIANKKLNKEGSMISGYSAALECGKANSVIIDSASLFLRNECNLHGMKHFDNMRLDDVILFAAAMMIEADGPLAKVFKRVIMDKHELLPEVQDLNYEDKLGLSAWINNQRVFLGNRDMLINHNIDVPHENSELKYTHDSRKVMYLAVEGKLAAMFVVSYKADKSLERPLHILDSNGISILVRTNDSNITENMLAEEFGLSANSIKILNSLAGNTFKEYRNTVKKTALAGIVHNGQSKSFLRSVASANNLTLTSNIMMTIQLASIVLGLILSLLFVFLSSLFGPVQLIAFMLVWSLVMILIPIIKR